MTNELNVIQEYYEGDLKIKVIAGFTGIAPRRITTRKSSTQTHNNYLAAWCAAKRGRLGKLTKHSPLCRSWFEKRAYKLEPLYTPAFERYVKPLIELIEKLEQEELE